MMAEQGMVVGTSESLHLDLIVSGGGVGMCTSFETSKTSPDLVTHLQ